MPLRQSAARRTDEQLEARDLVRESIENIRGEVESLVENFDSMHVKDKVKIGVSVVMYDLDGSETVISATIGAAPVMQGFLAKSYNKNRRVNNATGIETLLGLDN